MRGQLLCLLMAVAGCVTGPEPLPELEPNIDVYGACSDVYGRTLCLEEEELCSLIEMGPVTHFVCTQECELGPDCPPPSGGSTVPECLENGCVLPCAEEADCPSGMECQGTTMTYCVWPVP